MCAQCRKLVADEGMFFGQGTELGCRAATEINPVLRGQFKKIHAVLEEADCRLLRGSKELRQEFAAQAQTNRLIGGCVGIAVQSR